MPDYSSFFSSVVSSYRRPRTMEELRDSFGKKKYRQQRLVRFINDLDKKLDSLENEENLDYVNASIENDLLNGYGCFLGDMNVR